MDRESEERVAPRLRRALWTREEGDGDPGPLAVDPARLTGGAGRWTDEHEEVPLRGRLRRALLALD